MTPIGMTAAEAWSVCVGCACLALALGWAGREIALRLRDRRLNRMHWEGEA